MVWILSNWVPTLNPMAAWDMFFISFLLVGLDIFFQSFHQNGTQKWTDVSGVFPYRRKYNWTNFLFLKNY